MTPERAIVDDREASAIANTLLDFPLVHLAIAFVPLATRQLASKALLPWNVRPLLKDAAPSR